MNLVNLEKIFGEMQVDTRKEVCKIIVSEKTYALLKTAATMPEISITSPLPLSMHGVEIISDLRVPEDKFLTVTNEQYKYFSGLARVQRLLDRLDVTWLDLLFEHLLKQSPDDEPTCNPHH